MHESVHNAFRHRIEVLGGADDLVAHVVLDVRGADCAGVPEVSDLLTSAHRSTNSDSTCIGRTMPLSHSAGQR